MNKYDQLVKDLKYQIDFIADESFDFDYFQDTLQQLKELHFNDLQYNQIIENILKKYNFIDLDEIAMNLKVWCRPVDLGHPEDGYYYLFIKTGKPNNFEIVQVEDSEPNKRNAFVKLEENGITFKFSNPIKFENILKNLD